MRYALRSFFAFIGLLVISPAVFAATFTGAADIYEVKIAKIELYNSTTSAWTTIYDGLTGAIDIAAGISGEAAGEFVSGLVIPDGVYTKAKVTPGTSFVVEGTIGAVHTTSTTFDTGDGRTISVASNLGSPQECPVTILASDAATIGAVEQDFSGTPITVQGGTADKTIRVLFDVSNALTYDDVAGVIYPNPPVVSVTIN